MERKINREDLKELQELLVRTVVDFIGKRGLYDVWRLEFSVDDIQSSVEYGDWHCSSDSYIKAEGIHYEDGVPVRYELESF